MVPPLCLVLLPPEYSIELSSCQEGTKWKQVTKAGCKDLASWGKEEAQTLHAIIARFLFCTKRQSQL